MAIASSHKSQCGHLGSMNLFGWSEGYFFCCFRFMYFYFVCMVGLPSCVSVHCVYVHNAQKGQTRVRYPRAGVGDGCELPFRCWDTHPGPQQGQPVLSNTEPSL